MFVTFGLDQSRRDDYDTDACLEYSEEEVQQQFLDFYQDVLPEFRTAGKVLQFKVTTSPTMEDTRFPSCILIIT